VATNVNDLFEDLLWKIRPQTGESVVEDSRAGVVYTMPTPVVFTMERPMERVLFCPKRKANPYFHVMETVWMLAGEQSVDFLLPFNSNMVSFAEDDGNIHGAYGHRWRNHFDHDQILMVIDRLKADPTTRQAVIAMWDGSNDLFSHYRDRPCNTQLMFRAVDGRLHMSVTNRSNDLVWGACGANAVHMTYLHELVARATGLEQGRYIVFSNNLHIYERHWEMLENPACHDLYQSVEVEPFPILHQGEHHTDLLKDCEEFIWEGDSKMYRTRWVNEVVVPMYGHYQCRLNGDKHTYDLSETSATDWKAAEQLWRIWHD